MCMCLSVAHGANNARSSLGVFKVMQTLHASGSVPLMVELGYPWRLAAAFGMMLGSLFLGFRLTPVSGVAIQPFVNTLISTLEFLISLKGSIIIDKAYFTLLAGLCCCWHWCHVAAIVQLSMSCVASNLVPTGATLASICFAKAARATSYLVVSPRVFPAHLHCGAHLQSRPENHAAKPVWLIYL